MTPSERNRLQNDVYNHIAEMMTEDFRKIGWTNWNPDIHATPEQLDRIKRASDSYNGIQLPNTARTQQPELSEAAAVRFILPAETAVAVRISGSADCHVSICILLP